MQSFCRGFNGILIMVIINNRILPIRRGRPPCLPWATTEGCPYRLVWAITGPFWLVWVVTTSLGGLIQGCPYIKSSCGFRHFCPTILCQPNNGMEMVGHDLKATNLYTPNDPW